MEPNHDTRYDVEWSPRGIADPATLYSWDDVVKYIEDAGREGVDENVQQLTEGAGWENDEAQELAYKRFRPTIRMVSPMHYKAAILAEYVPGGRESYFTIHVYVHTEAPTEGED